MPISSWSFDIRKSTLIRQANNIFSHDFSDQQKGVYVAGTDKT
jgi:hypothetical protein